MNKRGGVIKKVLLCDAAFSVLPILSALKERGYFVGVCGNRSSDPCHGLADQSLLINYADIEQLAVAFQQNGYEYIVPGCTDVSYVSSCHIANRFRLPGFNDLENLALFQDKAAFRFNCSRNNVSVPRFTQDITQVQQLRFPLLAKPIDSFSGRGIVRIHNPSELAQFQNSSSYVYEEVVEGKLYSHSAFIRNGRILTDFFVNEYCTVYPYQVNSSNLAVTLDDKIRQGIRKNMEHFIAANSLCDGLLHTQLIINHDRFWLIEATRRCPGDLYSLLIQKTTGVPYAALYCASFCGDAINSPGMAAVQPVSRHTVSVKEDCIFISSRLSGAFDESSYVPLRKTGEHLKAAPYDRAGIYFVTHQSLNDMEARTERLVDHVIVEVQPVPKAAVQHP